jgi:hypothetical protein
MIEKAATCLAATCLNRQQHVWLQRAGTGCNIMLHFVTTAIFMVSSLSFFSCRCPCCHGLLHCQQSLKFLRVVGDIAKHF